MTSNSNKQGISFNVENVESCSSNPSSNIVYSSPPKASCSRVQFIEMTHQEDPDSSNSNPLNSCQTPGTSSNNNTKNNNNVTNNPSCSSTSTTKPLKSALRKVPEPFSGCSSKWSLQPKLSDSSKAATAYKLLQEMQNSQGLYPAVVSLKEPFNSTFAKHFEPPPPVSPVDTSWKYVINSPPPDHESIGDGDDDDSNMDLDTSTTTATIIICGAIIMGIIIAWRLL